jgi:chromosome segregation ATPase
LALEQKISFVTQEKNDAIEVMKKEFQCKESEMLEQIRSLQNKLDDIAVEKANIEARLSCAKQQSEISSEKLNLKEITIKEYEAELSRVSAEFRDAEEALKTKLSAVEHNLKKANSRIGLLTSKLSQAEEDKIAFLVERENEKSQMEYNLGNEIDGLKAAIAWAISEQEKLREQLLSSQDQTKQLQENLETVKNAAASKDDEIKALLEEKERNAKSSKIESDESDLEMRSKITSSLEVERDELLEEVFIINEELRDVVNENLDLKTLLRESKAEIVRLAADFDALIEKNNSAMSKEQHQKERLMEELNYYKDLCADCQNTIEKNNQELSDMRSQCSMLQDQLTDARLKLQQTIDGQQELKRSYHDSCEKLRAQEASFQNVQNELEEKVRSYEQEVSKLKEISESYCMQLAELQMMHHKSEEDNAENLAKLAEASSQMLHLKDRFDAQLAEKEEELGVLDLKVKSLECDCLSLKKQNKAMASTEVEMQEKYNNLKDRHVLLEREKGNLEFEIDTMQADHDALGDQVRLLSERVSMLEDENKRLKIFVEKTKCGDSHGKLSEIISSSGSTWNSDSRLSYDTLATNMDSSIKMMSTAKSKSNLTPQENVKDVENDKSANECLDNSFDESMFLPNCEDQLEIGGNTGHLPPNNLVTSAKKAPLDVYRETDENQGRQACVTFSTPRKEKDDYGNRRVPLSDKKNQTPLTNQSKRLCSSAKKVMSTSKKLRTKYLLIDNKQLFN